MILRQVKHTIKRYHLFDKGDKVLVGVSGGPDSIALLYLLNALKKELRISLHIAHLDHGLRNASGRDRLFVEKLAAKLGLPISSMRLNTKKLHRKGSLEENARRARLNFFFKTAKKNHIDKIALGHNRDDQAETVLMRILRGTGLYGLSGILPKRELYGHQIVRPLIETRRKDIEGFLKRRKIRFRRDVSNMRDIYFRNKIRNRLLPLLEKGYNRNIKEVLSSMAQSTGYDYDYLDKAAESAFRNTRRRLANEKLLRLHPAIRRLLLRMHIARLKGDTRRITFRHIQELEDLLYNRPPNSIVDLPQGICAVKKKGNFLFYRKRPLVQ